MDPIDNRQDDEQDEEPDSFQMTSASGIVSFWPTSASVMRQMRESEQRQAQARVLTAENMASDEPNDDNARFPETRGKPTSSSSKESGTEDSEKAVSSSSPDSSADRSSGTDTQENAEKSAAFDIKTPSPKSAYGSETWSDWSRAARGSPSSENQEDSENVMLSPSFSPVKQSGLAVIASAYADDETDQEDSGSFEVSDSNGILFMGNSQPFQDISNREDRSSRHRTPLQSSQPGRGDTVSDPDMSHQVVTETTASRWDQSSPSSATASSEKQEDPVLPAADDFGDHMDFGDLVGFDIEPVPAEEEVMEDQETGGEKVIVPVKKKPRKTKKSGLVFQCHRRFQRKLKKLSLLRVSGMGAVYLTGVIEYLTAELIELAGNAARELKAKRLIPRHIMLAIKGDRELDEFLNNVIIQGGGVYPFIHKFVRPKTKSER